VKLYSHQQKLISEDPVKTGIWWGTGSGKSICALMLARGKTLVICPKTIRDDGTWPRNMKKAGLKLDLTVLSKEDFKAKAATLPTFDAVIVDEAHVFCGVTPNIQWRKKVAYPKASQLFNMLDQYFKDHEPERLYLLTATPIKSPMAVWAAAKLLGMDINWYSFRDEFYIQLNMPGKTVYQAKSDSASKDKLGRLVRKLGYTGRLDEWMDVPQQTHITKQIPLSSEQQEAIRKLPYDFPEPIVLLGKTHQVENGVLSGDEFNAGKYFLNGKTDAILDLLAQYPKVLVFAKYTAQIRVIETGIREADIPVFTLTGDTKDRGEVIRAAEASERCAIIVQSQISVGYELPSFRCTVFASESWSVVDHLQAIGRTLRMNHLEKNLYVYLVSGEIDEAVREAIENKRDFSERIYLKI